MQSQFKEFEHLSSLYMKRLGTPKGNYHFYVNVNEVNPGPILLCGTHTVVLCCDGDFNWLGRVWGGGVGRFDQKLTSHC